MQKILQEDYTTNSNGADESVEVFRAEAKLARKDDLVHYHPDKWAVQRIRLAGGDQAFAELLEAHQTLEQFLNNPRMPAWLILGQLTMYIK